MRLLLAFLDAVLGLLTRRTHLGLANIPRTGAAVVVSNHVSISDPVVLACAIHRARRRPTFLAMAEAFRWPVVGAILKRTGQIPVLRGCGSSADALEPALAALARGDVVALYPEGKITTEPDYRPMVKARTGAVRLALEAGCPIVPVAQWGAHELLTREHTSSLTRPARLFGWLRPGRRPRRPKIVVLAGEPIGIDELSAPGDLHVATDLVMDRIRTLLAEITGEDDAPTRDAA